MTTPFHCQALHPLIPFVQPLKSVSNIVIELHFAKIILLEAASYSRPGRRIIHYKSRSQISFSGIFRTLLYLSRLSRRSRFHVFQITRKSPYVTELGIFISLF